MKRLVGFAGMLLATSAVAGVPGDSILQSATVTTPEDFMAGHTGAAGLICETRARHRPAPKLEVTSGALPDVSEISAANYSRNSFLPY